MRTDDTIETLNDLIEICKDGEKGFKTCAENVKDSELRAVFLQHAAECKHSAEELAVLVKQLGGDPDSTSSLAGAVHRGWVTTKAALTSNDDKAVLEECERGEDVAVASYRRALEKNLPESVRGVVEKQHQGALRNHDHIRALRDRYRGPAR